MREFKKELLQQQEKLEKSECLVGTVDFLCWVTGFILEGERITNAIHIQDYADRSAERWLTVPEHLPRRPQPAHTVETLDQVRKPRMDDAMGAIRNAMSVGYISGPIAYGGTAYERKDVLMLQNKLLQKAHAAFVKGPPLKEAKSKPILRPRRFVSAEHATSAESVELIGGLSNSLSHQSSLDFLPQPGANGVDVCSHECGRSQTTGKKFGSDGEDCDLKCVSPDLKGRLRQRPGSQEQPHAMGSRGTMHGGLGETSPPCAGQSALKLPLINLGEQPSCAGQSVVVCGCEAFAGVTSGSAPSKCIPAR